MNHQETKIITEVFPTAEALAPVRRNLLDACLDKLHESAGDSLAPWDIHYTWHDELMTESSVTGIIRIKMDEYLFHFNFVTNTLIKLVVPTPVDPDDELQVAEAEENQPYSLFGEDGEDSRND